MTKKALAYSVIESIKDRDYESNLLSVDPTLSEETAKEFSRKIQSTYSDILESARGLDETYRLSDVE